MMTLLVGRRPRFRGCGDRAGSRAPEAPQTERVVPDLEQRLYAQNAGIPPGHGSNALGAVAAARGEPIYQTVDWRAPCPAQNIPLSRPTPITGAAITCSRASSRAPSAAWNGR